MTIIRQKLVRPAPQDGGAERAWRQALNRAAMEHAGLDLLVTAARIEVMAAAAFVARVPEHALALMVAGPEGGRGAAVLSPALTSALVEVQMTRRLAPKWHPRKPTRTDGALAAGVMDAALSGLAKLLEDEADRVWAAGFGCDTFLPDTDSLKLALPEADLRVLIAEVTLAGTRQAQLMLALPTEGRGTAPAGKDSSRDETAFRSDLAAQVMEAETALEAVLCRMTVPLAAVIGLKVGETIPLPSASVEQVACETGCGATVATGRLGQNKGMRAIRISIGPAAEVVPLRAAG
ncbi:FliM/FliN family flagellar motor switch protein [Falsirhodobacter deserti]|uniref:FliM/FliN family flagellar motor switch protein n=1 Tax=Falsirhodobacter deserti TaxID=1365611 RepID=UPI0013E3C109|nr:FliM/FliN family flagellar motor switch protein [Falsirhodobacter deserti]